MACEPPVQRQYSHEALLDGEIRLIEFCDSTGTALSLSKNSLGSTPRYIALSYRWSEPAVHSISIDGKSFHVGQNLYDALRALAGQVRAEECLFWVDAICIDQKNTPERNAQVKIMKSIYECSERVFSWLGVPPADVHETELAVDLMSRLRVSLETAWQTGGEDLDAIQNLATANHFAFLGDTSSSLAKAWRGIESIFTSSYWQRTWIYQEATTPVSIDFFVGKYHFSGLEIYPVIHFATKFSEFKGENQRLFKSVSQGGYASQMYNARLIRAQGAERRLLDLLEEIKSTVASDAHDKVYACLGHACDAGNNPQIPFAYDRSIVDVYVDVVRFALENWQISPLEFLSFVCISSPDSNSRFLRQVLDPVVPSWMPDWRQQSHARHITAIDSLGKPLYDPAPGTIADAHISGSELVVRGMTSTLFDITFVTDLKWQSHSSSEFKPLISMFFETKGMAEGTENDKAQIMDVLGRTAVLDRSDTVDNTTLDGLWLSTYKRGGNIDWNLANATPTELSVHDQVRRDAQFERIQAGLFGRRLGWVGSEQSGHCGSFPPATQVGDRVALFFGGKSLYVLRPLTKVGNEVYQFIGECYVDGLMDGQLLETCRQEGGSNVIFQLR